MRGGKVVKGVKDKGARGARGAIKGARGGKMRGAQSTARQEGL